MFTTEFKIRWNDLDANMHLANSAYIQYFSQTRMAFLESIGFSMGDMKRLGIGPVVFHEHVYYFKEIFYGAPVTVSLEVKGMSEDGMFFEFEHNIFTENGNNAARSIILGGWIDQSKRSLTGLPDELLKSFDESHKKNDFRVLTSEDTRVAGIKPTKLSDKQ